MLVLQWNYLNLEVDWELFEVFTPFLFYFILQETIGNKGLMDIRTIGLKVLDSRSRSPRNEVANSSVIKYSSFIIQIHDSIQIRRTFANGRPIKKKTKKANQGSSLKGTKQAA